VNSFSRSGFSARAALRADLEAGSAPQQPRCARLPLRGQHRLTWSRYAAAAFDRFRPAVSRLTAHAGRRARAPEVAASV